MVIPDDWLYEYAIVRFVPRADRGEFINIGLIMMNKRKKWMEAKIHLDEKRLQTFFPKVDLKSLEMQCRLFERRDVPASDLPIEEKYRWLTAEKSAVIRVSSSHPGIVFPRTQKELIPEEIMRNEFERLFNDLVLQP